MRVLCLALLLSIAHAAGAQTTDRATEELRAEMVFWESVRSSNDPADYRAYLEQYPNGKFAVLARNRLATLSAPQSPPSAPAPTSSAPTQAKQQTAPGATESQESRGGGGRGRRGRQGTQPTQP